MLVYSPVLTLVLTSVHSPVRPAAYRAHGQKPATPLKLVATILGVRASQSDDVLPSSRWSVRDPHLQCSFRVRAVHIVSFLQQHLQFTLSIVWKKSLHIVYFSSSTMSYYPSCWTTFFLPLPLPLLLFRHFLAWKLSVTYHVTLSYTLLHSFTLSYTGLHSLTLSYTLIHSLALSYTLSHSLTLSYTLLHSLTPP
jgi:hypothetical protein